MTNRTSTTTDFQQNQREVELASCDLQAGLRVEKHENTSYQEKRVEKHELKEKRVEKHKKRD